MMMVRQNFQTKSQSLILSLTDSFLCCIRAWLWSMACLVKLNAVAACWLVWHVDQFAESELLFFFFLQDHAKGYGKQIQLPHAGR